MKSWPSSLARVDIGWVVCGCAHCGGFLLSISREVKERMKCQKDSGKQKKRDANGWLHGSLWIVQWERAN